MDKKIILGTILLLAIGAVAVVGITAPTGNAIAKPTQCQGQCGVNGCAATSGSSCDCETCPGIVCAEQSCEGTCSNSGCEAKAGRSCGC